MMMIRLHSLMISSISYESMSHDGSVELLATLYDSRGQSYSKAGEGGSRG